MTKKEKLANIICWIISAVALGSEIYAINAEHEMLLIAAFVTGILAIGGCLYFDAVQDRAIWGFLAAGVALIIFFAAQFNSESFVSSTCKAWLSLGSLFYFFMLNPWIEKRFFIK